MAISGQSLNIDGFVHCINYLEPTDIYSLANVCRQYNEWLNIPAIWEEVSARFGIPVVNRSDDERYKRREDFRVLYPMTISGHDIAQYFGRMAEPVPPICDALFSELNKPDRSGVGTIGKNYLFVVRPSRIIRHVDRDTPLDIDDKGNLKETASNMVKKRDILIPFSLRNHALLCKYLLKGKEKGPVFSADSWDEAFAKRTSFSDKVEVCLMRKRLAEETRGLDFYGQVGILRAKELKVTSLEVRALADSIHILKTGTSLDAPLNPRSAVIRTSSTLTVGDHIYQLAIKTFIPGIGERIFGLDMDDVDNGVVPCIPAEVPGPLELGRLALN